MDVSTMGATPYNTANWISVFMLCSCCCENVNDLDATFGERDAKRDAKRYRNKGLKKRAQKMIAPFLHERELSVMEIGCGAGALHQELVRKGVAAEVTGVDVSTAYLAAAKGNADHFGVSDKITYHNTDFAQVADEFAPVDVVMLDRVICCYPHLDKLLGQAAERATQYLAISFPTEAWWFKVFFTIADKVLTLFGSGYHPYLHSHSDIQRYATSSGLHLISDDYQGIWRVMVFGK